MKGHRFRIYLQTFDDNGAYTGTYTDVSDDVELESLGSIDQNLDNTDYNIGIYRNSNVSITFRNDNGKYSDVGQPTSVFRYKRNGALIKITWQESLERPKCGFVQAGDFSIAEELTLFIGLLDDSSTSMDLDNQELSFSLLGRETILNNGTVPFASLSNGMLLSDVIKTLLDQPFITTLLDYAAINISVGVDVVIDSITDLENKSVWDALTDLLLITNSIFYIQNSTIFVKPRLEDTVAAYTFYGQSSIVGVENIVSIRNIQNGFNKLFNYFYWTPSNEFVSDASSVAKYGVFRKKLDFTYITNTVSQTSIMNSLLTEFKLPKQQFDVYTPINYQTLALFLLNKILIDFPPMYLPGANDFPICGTAICGSAVLPDAIWSFTENIANPYKIIGTSIDPQTNLITFNLRRTLT